MLRSVLICLSLASGLTAPIWPVPGWPSGYPAQPTNLCANIPNSGTKAWCTSANCCVPTTGDGPKHLKSAMEAAWNLKGCSTPVVYTNNDHPYGNSGLYNIVINKPIILYLDNGASITAPEPEDWVCDGDDAVPFIEITASGVALCGPGDGGKTSSRGGLINGNGFKNGWYDQANDGKNCGNDFKYPKGSQCYKNDAEGAPILISIDGSANNQINGFSIVGISLQDSPRYTVVPTYVQGVYIQYLYMTNNLPDGPDSTCNVDGLHFNAVTGAIVTDSSVQTGDDGIVMAYGNQWVSVSNSNVYNGHGTTVGQTGLTGTHPYCNQYIAFQSITGIDQRWSFRLKAPPQESYNTLNILYTDYCSAGAQQPLSVVTVQGGQVCSGQTNMRVSVNDFNVYPAGTTGSPCPDRLNPSSTLGPGQGASKWKYKKSDSRKNSIQCLGNSSNSQIVNCGFFVTGYTCTSGSGAASCTIADCNKNALPTSASYLAGDSTANSFSACTTVATIPAVDPATNFCSPYKNSGNNNCKKSSSKKEDL